MAQDFIEIIQEIRSDVKELVKFAHALDNKNVKQDAEIEHNAMSIIELQQDQKSLKKQSAQISGATKVLVLLCSGGLIGLIAKLAGII